MKSKLTHYTLSTLKIISISSLTIFTLYSAQAVWTPPPQSAPNGNVGGPLTTATTSQVKTGGLGLMGGLTVANLLTAGGGLNVSGSFKFATTSAGVGKVLVSDPNGNASWVATSSLGISSSALTVSSSTSYSSLPTGGMTGWCFEDSYLNYTSSTLPAKTVPTYVRYPVCTYPDIDSDGNTKLFPYPPLNVTSYSQVPFDTSIKSSINTSVWPGITVTCSYSYSTLPATCGCENGFTSRLTGTLHSGTGTDVDFYYTCVKN